MLRRANEIFKNFVYRTVVILLITIALLFVLEFGVRAFVGDPIISQEQLDTPIGLRPAELADSDAYRQFAWTQDYLDELERHPTPSLEYAPFRLWKRQPYKNKYISYDEDGFRITVNAQNPSCTEKKRVFIFGGSTIEGSIFLRDVDTIPSILSIHLSANYPSTCFEVRNFGQGGYNHENETVLLMQLLSFGERPDLVIFYDGANDVWHRVLMGHPHMSYGTFLRMTGVWGGSESIPGFLETAIVKLARRSALVKLFQPKLDRPNYPSQIIPGDDLDRRAEQLARLYCGKLNVVSSLRKQFGFRTLAVLQPILFFKDHQSAEELRLLKGIRLVLPSVEDAYIKTYEAIRRRYSRDPQCGDTLDLSDVLDSKKESIYIDAVHLSPVGNQEVARALFAELQRRGWI